MDFKIENIMFEMWWTENNDRLMISNKECVKEMVKLIWTEQFKLHQAELKNKDKVIECVLTHANEVSSVIERVRKNYGIPASDYWTDGIKGIEGYCKEIHMEVNHLRTEVRDLQYAIADLERRNNELFEKTMKKD